MDLSSSLHSAIKMPCDLLPLWLRLFIGQPEGWTGCFGRVLDRDCVLEWVRVSFLGEGWVKAGLGKAATAYGSFSRGHWRPVPLPTSSGPTYHLPVSGGSSEQLLRFQPGVCASGIVGDPGAGGWPVAGRALGTLSPLGYLWSGTSWEREKLRYLLHFPPEIELPQSPLVLPPSCLLAPGKWGEALRQRRGRRGRQK